MIKKVEISNYRSCLNCSFDLQPHLSVLIGPNSSGKTNILNALLLLRKLAQEDEPFNVVEEMPTAKSKLKVSFNIGEKKAILTAIVQTYTDDDNSDVLLGSQQQWYMKDFTGSAKRVHMPLWFAGYAGNKRQIGKRGLSMTGLIYYQRARRNKIVRITSPEAIDESARKALVSIMHFVSEMRYYSASQFTNPANCPVSFEIEKEGMRSRGLRLRGHAKFLFDLYPEFRAKSSGYQQFFEIIGPSGIGLVDDIGFKEMVTSSVDYSVRSGGRVKERKRDKILLIPQFTIGKHELSPNQLSEGTFKTITLLFYLVTEVSSILLVEEPEVCVHHGLLSSIIELIKTYSRDKQIVLSTHSDFVLDHVSPVNVYKVERTPEEGTNVTHIPKSMSTQEYKALKEYLEKEGNLGEYWKHGALE